MQWTREQSPFDKSVRGAESLGAAISGSAPRATWVCAWAKLYKMQSSENTHEDQPSACRKGLAANDPWSRDVRMGTALLLGGYALNHRHSYCHSFRRVRSTLATPARLNKKTKVSETNSNVKETTDAKLRFVCLPEPVSIFR